MEWVVVLLCLRRCNGRGTGNRRLLVHALPEGVLGLFGRTLDSGRAHSRRFRDRRNHHACRWCALVGGDPCRTFVVVAAVIVADRLKLGSQLTLFFFSSLDLSTLSRKSSLLLCGVLLCGCTTLLLLRPLQLTSFDFFFKSAQGSLLFLALLLQLAFLSSFLIPSKLLVSLEAMV